MADKVGGYLPSTVQNILKFQNHANVLYVQKENQ
jgi:hypothetical protein